MQAQSGPEIVGPCFTLALLPGMSSRAVTVLAWLTETCLVIKIAIWMRVGPLARITDTVH